MVVKDDWENGEQFNATDANALAEAVNSAYVKPSLGVPITDLTSAVQLSLGRADSAVQAVDADSISDATTTGRSVLTAADSAAARSALGVAYGSTSGTVVQGDDSRLSPAAAAISDASTVGRAVLTAIDAAAARTTLGVAYGTTSTSVAVGNDSRITGAVATGSAATLASVTAFNTADATNFERGRIHWNANAFTVSADQAGTGVARDAVVSSGTSSLVVRPGGNFGKVFLSGSSSSGTGGTVQVSGTLNASSGTQFACNVVPTINESGTAGYTALLINPTETATGSGTKRLIDAQVGGASRLTVDNAGLLNAVGGVQVNGVPVVTTTGNQTITGKQMTTIELGHASDTTLTRSAAGVLAVEGVDVVTTSATQTLTGKTLTSPRINEIRDLAGNSNIGIAPYDGLTLSVNAAKHGIYSQTTATDGGWHAAYFSRSGSTGSFLGFYYGAGTLVGNISTNGSATTYGTTSDYRLKLEPTDMTDGLARINALRPVTFQWALDESDGEGFLAHELQEVIPLAVDGDKDAVNEDGSILPQNVDYSKVVPHLVVAVQELTAKLEAAEDRITALEAAVNAAS